MSDLIDVIDRDAAYAAISSLIPECEIIGQRTILSKALTAIRALPAVEVGVKPLEWVQCQSTLPRVVFEAFSCLGRYVAWPNGNWKRFGHYGYEQEGDLETAMAAAQADYAAHLRPALTVTPAPDAGKVEALIEALEKINVGEGWAAKIARAALAAMKETDHE